MNLIEQVHHQFPQMIELKKVFILKEKQNINFYINRINNKCFIHSSY
jgi:hypothetical protein